MSIPSPTYDLVGFANLHGVVPAFVYPVFKGKDGNYYLEDGNPDTIRSFRLVQLDQSRITTVKGVPSGKFPYQVGSKTQYAFMLEDGHIEYGDKDFITGFIKQYRKSGIEDALLLDELDSVLKSLKYPNIDSPISTDRAAKYIGRALLCFFPENDPKHKFPEKTAKFSTIKYTNVPDGVRREIANTTTRQGSGRLKVK